MSIPNNTEFLNALFGSEAPWVHVTCFTYDPGDIPADRHLRAWKGDFFSRYNMQDNTNQYFTISNFYTDEQGSARRRKALYRQTPVIVLDDVKEKLSMDEVSKLPSPSWILETSPGSEQWGYILNTPCTDRGMVENLLDGLVANGLAPDGKDPGMKGVTRYVRLPDGVNTKKSKMINGEPFKCRITLWEPFNTVTIEDLAKPFHVNLNAPRRESRVDGAADIANHPLVNMPDVIHVKEIRSAGRFDITCPWVEDHTGGEDNGAAVFTNGDHTIGFKCHHGSCQGRTGKDLLDYVEEVSPGFGRQFAEWKVIQSFTEISEPTFLAPVVPQVPAIEQVEEPTFLAAPSAPSVPVASAFDTIINQLRQFPPTSQEARTLASNMLQSVEELSTIDKIHWHTQVCDVMRWNKSEFKEILKDLRSTWYVQSKAEVNFFDEVVYIGELNQFFDRKKNIFYSAEAYQNAYAHLDSEARKEALQGGRVTKVDKLDYAPKKPPVFEERGVMYGNSWSASNEVMGTPGDVTPWLNHFDTLGWSENKEHLIQWMAYTIRYPEHKINHMVILGSGEGCGKDWLLTPLAVAMEGNSRSIGGEDLLSNFNDYVLGTKYLNINETELGDRKEARAVSAKLKPLAAAPPVKLRVNPKGVKAIDVRNIVNCVMTTNSQLPIQLNGPSRRFYALWSDLNPRDEYDEMMPEWVEYWKQQWEWMNNGGAEAVIYHLRNVVDLSSFNPQSAPPMTQFLRDIRESSKSPAEQTIEAFIESRVGIFNSDVMTANDISNTLRAGSMVAPALMYCDERVFTPNMVGRIMKGMSNLVQMRGSSANKTSHRLWVVRNVNQYMRMGGSELYREYERQLQATRASAGMQVVN